MFDIKQYLSGKKGTIYTIHKKNDPENELDKFFNKENISDSGHLNELVAKLQNMTNRWGFQEQFFKTEEGSFYDNVVTLKDTGDIRLYCCRYGNIILIIGPGGVKDTRTYQEDPELNKAVEFMSEVSKLVDQRIRNKEIKYKGIKLSGDLSFDEE